MPSKFLRLAELRAKRDEKDEDIAVEDEDEGEDIMSEAAMSAMYKLGLGFSIEGEKRK